MKIKQNNHNKIVAAIALSATILLVGLLAILGPGKLFDAPVCAVLESSDGHLLGARIAADGQWRFPASESVPEKFAKAIVCYEDKRFYSHPGIDMAAVARAVSLNLRRREIVSGASTITMQTIRLSRGGKMRTLGEKLIEAALALRLELFCSKEEILALYASNAPFGGNVVGLDAAAWRYFSRSASQLSWAESAMLAVLPNSPSLIHLGKNRDALLAKRNFLLDKLFLSGVIDGEECLLAKDEPLPGEPRPMPNIAYHYLETLRKDGGDKLYKSHIDLGLQENVESVALRHSKMFESNGVSNLAIVVMDVSSGEVISYCGNVSSNTSPKGGNDVDIAASPRSSGSTLKPFLYAAMLDEGMILPTQLLPDIPFYYKDFTPNNFNNTFDGAVPAYSVIQRSLNVPSVRMLQEFGIEQFIKVLQGIGFTTITRGAEIYGLSLILGGAEITLTDLAKAYCGCAAHLNGFAEARVEENGVISAAAIWSTFEVLSDVNRPEEENNWKYFNSSRKVAWKTGTSHGNRDAWSVGVTPEYVVAVWAGNCDGEGRPHLTGIGYAAPLMFDVFNCLPRTSWFDVPEMGLEEVVVCRQSGYPISENCLHESSVYASEVGADTLLVPVAPHRPEPCSLHKIVHLSEDERYIVNSDCYPVSKMRSVSWFVLPPSQEWYYMRTHGDYKKLPPLHPNYVGNSDGLSRSVIEIIYPQPGMMVAAPVALDSKSQGVIFTAAHSDPDAVLFWHIDDHYLGTTLHGEHKVKVIPEKGSHRLTVVDGNGNSASVRFFGE